MRSGGFAQAIPTTRTSVAAPLAILNPAVSLSPETGTHSHQVATKTAAATTTAVDHRARSFTSPPECQGVVLRRCGCSGDPLTASSPDGCPQLVKHLG